MDQHQHEKQHNSGTRCPFGGFHRLAEAEFFSNRRSGKCGKQAEEEDANRDHGDEEHDDAENCRTKLLEFAEANQIPIAKDKRGEERSRSGRNVILA